MKAGESREQLWLHGVGHLSGGLCIGGGGVVGSDCRDFGRIILELSTIGCSMRGCSDSVLWTHI